MHDLSENLNNSPKLPLNWQTAGVIEMLGIFLDAFSRLGKKMRAELLVHLKERAGMTYREITQLDFFVDLELNNLGCIYRRAHLNRPE
jgi:hypothetical protein